MKPVPHTHTCFGCWVDYPCANEHCVDLEWRYCRLPTCPMPEIMKPTESLMDAGHLIDEARFILEQGGNGTEAYQAEWLRKRILDVLKVRDAELAAHARVNKDMMQGALETIRGKQAE